MDARAFVYKILRKFIPPVAVVGLSKRTPRKLSHCKFFIGQSTGFSQGSTVKPIFEPWDAAPSARKEAGKIS